MSNDLSGLGRRALLSGLTGSGLFPTVSTGSRSPSKPPVAQSPDSDSRIEWEWTHNRSPSTIHSLAVTPNGTIAATGFEVDSGGAGTQDLLLGELTPDGRKVGGITIPSGAEDAGLGITTTPSGEVVFAGGTGTRGSDLLDTYTGRFETPEDVSDVTTVGINGTNDAAHAIAADDSGVIIAGGTQYLGGADGEGVGRLVRLENGRTVWTETYGGGAPGELYDIQRTGTEFVFAGTQAADGAGQAWIGVVGNGGTVRWEETYGGVGSRTAYSVVPARDGGFIFVGTTTAPGQDTPLAWVGRVDDEGTLIWEETYGTANGSAAYAVERDPEQGYVVAGYTTERGSEDGWLVHIDEQGRVVLEETYGEGGIGRFQELVRFDDNYVAAGVKNESNGEPTGWILKTSGPASNLVEAVSMPAERLSKTLERHLEERQEAVLEEAYSHTDVLNDDVLPEVNTGEAIQEGLGLSFDLAEDVLINPGEYGDLKQGGALMATKIGGEMAIDALGDVLAGWTIDILSEDPELYAERYRSYLSDLDDQQWFLEPHEYTVDQPSVDHTALDTYQDAIESVQTLTDRIEKFGQRQPPLALNESHVESVFLQLAATLSDPAGIGSLARQSTYPTDTVILPDGSVLNTQRGAAHLSAIENAAEEYEDRDPLDWASLGAGITGLLLSAASVIVIGVGIAMMTIPEPGSSAVGVGLVLVITGKSIGAKATYATIASVSTDLLSSAQDLRPQRLILLRHLQIHLETLRDIDNLGRISDQSVGWLDDQYDDPTTGTVAGQIAFPVGFETTPDDALEPTESAENSAMELIQGTIDVEYEITGDASVPARILGYSSYYSDADEDLPPLQGFATTSPEPGESSLQAEEGDVGRRAVDYTFHHPTEDQFRQHIFSVHLVLEGRHVDTATAVADVTVDQGLFSALFGAPGGPGQLSAGRTDQTSDHLPYATADTPQARSMTTQEVNDLRGETTVLASERLAGGERLSRTVTVSGELRSVAFTLFVPPGLQTELSIMGPTGTAVVAPEGTSDTLGMEASVHSATGAQQVVVYPTRDTEFSIAVDVPPGQPRPTSITLLEIDTPERPPVVGVNPTQLSLYGNPTEQIGREFFVTEVGNQQPIEGLAVTAGALLNDAGSELTAEAVTAVTETNQVAASERTPVSVIVETPEPAAFDGEPTRFDGRIEIDTENAGSLGLPLSVLLLDSTVEEGRLLDADPSVRRAAVRTRSPEAVPEPPTETLGLYRVTVDGDGPATISFSPPPEAEATNVEITRLSDGRYEPVDPDTSVRSSIMSFEPGEHTVALLAQTDDDESEVSGGTDDGTDGDAAELADGFPLSEEELAGAGLVTLSLLYLAARATSDGDGEQ